MEWDALARVNGQQRDMNMIKVVSFIKLVTGGYNVLVRGEFFGWARMQDTAAELAGIALIAAF